MVVIIREPRVIGGEKVDNVKVYKTSAGEFLTKKAKEEAEKIDKFLDIKMKEIQKQMLQKNLINLKNKSGALKLWYELGKNLEFVMNKKIINPAERILIWRAIYDHAGKLAPGSPNTRSIGARNHFWYCYKLSRFPWSFVESAGNWSEWTEFFDSEAIRNDDRIIKWLMTKSNKLTNSRRGWLRDLTKRIRNLFKNMDTLVFNEQELFKEMDNQLLS